jgi:hypothetical protein
MTSCGALHIVSVLPNTCLHESVNVRKALVRVEIQKKYSLKPENIDILNITKWAEHTKWSIEQTTFYWLYSVHQISDP